LPQRAAEGAGAEARGTTVGETNMIRSMTNRRSTRASARHHGLVATEKLEPRQLMAAVFDSGGFESPRYTTGPLEGQDLLGPWQEDNATAGIARIQTDVVQSGQQAVRMVRPGAPDGDTRYGVVKPIVPNGVLNTIRVSWDMNVPQNAQANVPFGPFFGVEGYDGTVPTHPQLAGSLGVDATTGDVLYQDGTTGFLTETGFNVHLGEWNHFTLELNYTTKTYTVFVNGDDKATTGFVDDGVVGFTDAPLAALAATAESKPFATGAAYFDNYVIDIDAQNPNQPPAVNAVYVSGSSWSQDFKDYIQDKGYGSAQYGYAIPASDQLNELPWMNLNQVSIRFSENVKVDFEDLQIRGVNVPVYTLDPAGFHYDANTRTATWRLANGQSFDHDRILLDLDGDSPNGVADPQGNLLDGEWNNPGGPNISPGDQFPSGDGQAGGDFRFRMNVLAGDTERDGIVLANDYSEVKKRFFTSTKNETSDTGHYDIFHDIDGSGIILAFDYSEVKKRFFNTLPSGEPAGSTFGTSSIRVAAEVLA
jgi:hypothetical protein